MNWLCDSTSLVDYYDVIMMLKCYPTKLDSDVTADPCNDFFVCFDS